MSEEENDVSLPRATEPEVFDAEDTIKILLATDCHLGYERSTKRAQENDSLITFEEILQLAVEHEVDFILLGGDLFHDTKPPQDVVSKCIELLRKYCLGTRDIKIQLLTDPDIIFKHCDKKTVNFEDPNLNISIPVFSIHGNHDDPSSSAMGALDLLSSTGFVNYFGKWTDLTHVEIPPLILKKGNTYISLYGLSYINDKRLARIIRDGKFKMLRATEIPESFNMFVLHQNRTSHGYMNNLNHVKEEQLPDFLNFIMWGHEHECRISPEYYEIPDYWISQPGSSVATSLSEGEAVAKHVGILSVHKTNFKFKSIKLQTVRPFVIGNISVRKDMADLTTRIKDKDALCKAILKKVDRHIETEMIRQAVKLCTDNPNQPQLPLIRLRVHIVSEDEHFETMKLAQKYCDQVANPMDIVTFNRESKNMLKMDKTEDALGELAKLFSCSDIHDEIAWNRTVQDGIRTFFEKEENRDKLSVLSVAGLNEALALFTEGGHTDAFESLVNSQVNRTIDHLMNQEFDIQDDINIKTKIKEFQIERMLIEDSAEPEEVALLRMESVRKERERAAEQQNSSAIENNEDGDDEQVVAKPVSRGSGRGRGRGRGRAKVITILDDSNDEEGEDIQPPTTKGRGRGRARAQTTGTNKRGRGRAAKQLNSSLDVTITSSKPASKAPATSKAISSGSKFFRMGASQSQAKDDEFVDSD